MREIFAHCFLSESQKKYLEKNFALNIHNANEKILSDYIEPLQGQDDKPLTKEEVESLI